MRLNLIELAATVAAGLRNLLVSRIDVTLKHQADNRVVTLENLVGDIVGNQGLQLGVLL